MFLDLLCLRRALWSKQIVLLQWLPNWSSIVHIFTNEVNKKRESISVAQDLTWYPFCHLWVTGYFFSPMKVNKTCNLQFSLWYLLVSNVQSMCCAGKTVKLNFIILVQKQLACREICALRGHFCLKALLCKDNLQHIPLRSFKLLR